MADKSIERILGMLQGFLERPLEYVQPVEIPTVEAFLYGVRASCRFCGVSSDLFKAMESRGWEPLAASIEPQCRAAGMDDAAIIQELIALELDAFRWATQTSAE